MRRTKPPTATRMASAATKVLAAGAYASGDEKGRRWQRTMLGRTAMRAAAARICRREPLDSIDNRLSHSIGMRWIRTGYSSENICMIAWAPGKSANEFSEGRKGAANLVVAYFLRGVPQPAKVRNIHCMHADSGFCYGRIWNRKDNAMPSQCC